MLEQVDLDLSISKTEYKRRLPELQQRLYDLEHAVFQANVPVAVVFEGWAAAGKGGTVNVLTERLDARGFRVAPITPPRTTETRFPWLWRFWLKIPAYGQMVIYDTSWYRRVLIDRINKTVSKRRHRRFRGAVGGGWHGDCEVLAAHQQEGTGQAIQEAAER